MECSPMKFSLTEEWKKLNLKTIGSELYWHIALQNESALYDTVPLIKTYVKGTTLDLGAGKLAWRKHISKQARYYISADYIKEHKDLNLLMDATKPFPLGDSTFDTVFCYSVLEHTPAPWLILPEIYRVLKNNSYAILSVPFIFYLHGAPYDYYRFSRFGISKLASEAGFTVSKTVLNGGLFHFLLNLPSILISSFLHCCSCHFLIPFSSRIFMKVAQLIDRLLDPDGNFTMNVILVLKKEAR
jgi:SAM-dependent methyltransferase